MTTYLLAGGGTAGHVNPLLALADLVSEREPAAGVVVLGTAEGLEARLVPERGYELQTIDRLPFPRRPNAYALGFPARYARAVRRVPPASECARSVGSCGNIHATAPPPPRIAARN